MSNHRILDIVRRHGPISRAETARRLALSKPTVSVSVNQLVQQGLLKEVGQGRLPAGRSPRLLGFNPRYALVAGIDLGATNLRVALADLDGKILEQRLQKTPQGRDLAAQIAAILQQLMRRQALREPLAAVVMGTPGVFNASEQRIHYSPNLPALETPNFYGTLAKALGCPLEIHNDVNLAAIGEHQGDAGEITAFISIGTGLGAAVTSGTQVWQGQFGRAGEIGYLPFPSPVGTVLEEVLSGVGLANLYRHFGAHGDAAKVLSQSNAAAKRSKAILFDALALAVSVLTLCFDPARIVLGGGVGLHLEPYLRQIQQHLEDILPFVAPLEISRHGDLVTQNGAVRLAAQRANQELKL